MAKVLFSLAVIITGLGLGWAVRAAAESGRLRLSAELPRLRIRLQKFALLGIFPATYLGAVWNLSLHDIELAAMPFLGCGVLMLGGFLALAAARLLGLSDRQTGAYYCCGSFTNIGAIGAMVCHTFLGETAMNLSGIPRPAFFTTLNSVLVPLGSFIMLASIGLALRFSRLSAYLRECAVILAIKYICLPLAATSAAADLGFGHILGGVPLRVVLILSSMPVAFTALIPPSLYDLDIDLANACWFSSMLGMAAVLPALYWLTGLI